MKNPYIIPSLIIAGAILGGFWLLKQPRGTQKVLIVAPPKEITIHQAAKNNDINAIQLQLSKGVDINLRGESGKTALTIACLKKHTKLAEQLINKGANNIISQGGFTPLHFASSSGSYKVAKLLINKNFNLNVMDYTGGTPLDSASGKLKSESPETKESKKKIAALLTKNGGKRGYELSMVIAARNGEIDAVKHFLNKGTDINTSYTGMARFPGIPPSQYTSLHWAAHSGNIEIAELLISSGANINKKDSKGLTPLDKSRNIYEWESTKQRANKKYVGNLILKHGGKTGAELKAEDK